MTSLISQNEQQLSTYEFHCTMWYKQFSTVVDYSEEFLCCGTLLSIFMRFILKLEEKLPFVKLFQVFEEDDQPISRIWRWEIKRRFVSIF